MMDNISDLLLGVLLGGVVTKSITVAGSTIQAHISERYRMRQDLSSLYIKTGWDEHQFDLAITNGPCVNGVFTDEATQSDIDDIMQLRFYLFEDLMNADKLHAAAIGSGLFSAKELVEFGRVRTMIERIFISHGTTNGEPPLDADDESNVFHSPLIHNEELIRHFEFCAGERGWLQRLSGMFD